MNEAYETIAVEAVDEHRLVVRLNRPASANALNTAMGLEMRDLFTGLYVEPGDVRCIVLTGAGEKAFCAGGDLKERNGMTDAAWQRQHAIFEQMTLAVVECPIPIIAAVNGAAYGGGAELALGLRLHLRGAAGALRAHRGHPRHHAGRSRPPEPRAGPPGCGAPRRRC